MARPFGCSRRDDEAWIQREPRHLILVFAANRTDRHLNSERLLLVRRAGIANGQSTAGPMVCFGQRVPVSSFATDTQHALLELPASEQWSYFDISLRSGVGRTSSSPRRFRVRFREEALTQSGRFNIQRPQASSGDRADPHTFALDTSQGPRRIASFASLCGMPRAKS